MLTCIFHCFSIRCGLLCSCRCDCFACAVHEEQEEKQLRDGQSHAGQKVPANIRMLCNRSVCRSALCLGSCHHTCLYMSVCSDSWLLELLFRPCFSFCLLSLLCFLFFASVFGFISDLCFFVLSFFVVCLRHSMSASCFFIFHMAPFISSCFHYHFFVF